MRTCFDPPADGVGGGHRVTGLGVEVWRCWIVCVFCLGEVDVWGRMRCGTVATRYLGCAG